METNLSELELRVLYEISQTMGQALNLHHALDSILRILAGALATRRATVTLKDTETGHLVAAATYGLTPEEKQRGRVSPGRGIGRPRVAHCPTFRGAPGGPGAFVLK